MRSTPQPRLSPTAHTFAGYGPARCQRVLLARAETQLVALPARYLFDVYGTLLDVDSAVARCDTGQTRPAGFSALWRAKQLEYTWTLQAMGSYREFLSVTSAA